MVAAALNLTTRGRGLALCGIVLTAAGILLGFRDVTRIGVLLLALTLLARLSGTRQIPDMAVQRTVTPARVAADDSAEVTMEITNRGKRRSSVFSAEEELDPRLGPSLRFLLPPISTGQSRRVRYTLTPTARGRHRLGPIALRGEDAFGVTLLRGVQEQTADLVVMPRIFSLGSGGPSSAGLGVEGETPHMMALHGEEDISIRAYRDGDDLRKVHWPATAHRGELMVRQEEQPARRSAALLLDCRASVHSSGEPSQSFEWAVSALASVAVHLNSSGYTLHLISRETVLDGSAALDRDVTAVLDSLALAELGSDSDFQDTLHAAGVVAERAGTVIAACGARLDQDQMLAAVSLRRRGVVGQAFVIDAGPDHTASGGDEQPATATVAALRQAGWKAVAAAPSAPIPLAWQELTARQAGMLR
ncbi:DUF58 domain-containing protein [Dermacoccaceae bacterium W4C1]